MKVDILEWMKVLEKGFEESITAVSEVSVQRLGSVSTDRIHTMCGSLLQAQIGNIMCLQMGIHSKPETQQFLSELLEEDDPDDFLPDSDSSDAIGEILNMFAGYFIRNVFTDTSVPTVLTTPLYVYGQIDLPALKYFALQEVKVKDHKVSLFLGVTEIKK